MVTYYMYQWRRIGPERKVGGKGEVYEENRKVERNCLELIPQLWREGVNLQANKKKMLILMFKQDMLKIKKKSAFS